MMPLAIRRVALRIPRHTPLLVAMTVSLAAGAAFAAAVVGSQVELKATHQAGIPLHKEPRSTNDFQRVPDGTRATVLEVAPNGRWVKLALPDGRTGWVTSRYVRSPATGGSITGNLTRHPKAPAH